MKLPVYTIKGERVREIEVADGVFAAKVSPSTVHRVVVASQSNKRLSTAHTKTRGEVSGGGKKPWRQKGTGRARHGSTRSPIWRKGGVVFGPLNVRNYEKTITQSMKKNALRSVISDRVKNGTLVVVDQVPSGLSKTKAVAATLSGMRGGFDVLKVFSDKKKVRKPNQVLLLTEKHEKMLALAARNLKSMKIEEARNVNVLDLMRYRVCFVEEQAIPIMEKIARKVK